MAVGQPINMSLMDVSKIFSLLQPKEEDEDGEEARALNDAVGADDAALLSELLAQEKYRRRINAPSGWGIDVLDVKAQTPLFTAVSGKHLDCVAALLKAGADPNGSQYNNCSPVLTAAREGDVDVLRELLRFGAEVDVRPKVPEWASNATACRGPLYISAVYGHLSCFKLLLLHGANPNYNCTDEKMLARIKQPKTVVEVCLRYGCGVEYMQLLVDFGADVYLPTLIIDKTTKQNEALLLLLRERVCPKTLMSQARLAIRRHVPFADKDPAIDSLDIPLVLRNYLKHINAEPE
ncbi:hypothetical protein CCH79_00005865 [Gambusia affinis]|uniref:SOCS box domain-containing protein n=1 Tax=Gambusia affinis TaxID=33528 RepID=A0A315VW35_GAMAF|nr:hypothetical protein CCH79_00005865 [Gambusia affinis]